MRELHFDPLRLLEGDRRGLARDAARPALRAGAGAAETLHGVGFRGLRARGFKGRHVDALVALLRPPRSAGRTSRPRPSPPRPSP